MLAIPLLVAALAAAPGPSVSAAPSPIGRDATVVVHGAGFGPPTFCANHVAIAVDGRLRGIAHVGAGGRFQLAVHVGRTARIGVHPVVVRQRCTRRTDGARLDLVRRTHFEVVPPPPD